MSTGIKIGGDNMVREAAAPIADAIERIFESGHANAMEQATICCALEVLLKCAEISDIGDINDIFGDNPRISININEET